MKTPYIAELQPNQTITGVFLVSNKDVRQKKTGEPYLSLTLSDRTGDLDSKMWDNAAEVAYTFERDDFIRVKGLFQIYQNRPQLSIHKLQPVPLSEIDITDFLPASKRDRDEMFRELQGWIGGMQNPHLRTMIEGIFADPDVARMYRTAPAAKGVHHAWIGGLLEHVLSLCQLARFHAAHYPGIDFDLLLAGVILHDIGKIHELDYSRSFRYSDAGQLLGHIQIGAQMTLDQIRQQPDFPPRLRDLLLHMILSHHGHLEFGSPKVPLFPEALLLHLIDTLDAKMETMRSLIDRDPQVEGSWTGYNAALERAALKKDRYLNPPEPAAARPNQPSGTTQAPAQANGGPRREPQTSPFASKLQDALKRDT